jgi:hypothetical protein
MELSFCLTQGSKSCSAGTLPPRTIKGTGSKGQKIALESYNPSKTLKNNSERLEQVQ